MKNNNKNNEQFPEAINFDELLSNSLHKFYHIMLQSLINDIALKEREEYLKYNPDDSANGFYTRTLSYANIPLSINVPRTRSSNFFPGVIPKYRRTIPEVYEQLIDSIILNSRSIESAKRTVKRLGLPVNETIIEEIIDEHAAKFREYTTRELERDWLVVFADAKVIYVKEGEKVKKMVIMTAVGINMDGRKEVMGSEVFEGNETLERWREFFLSLRDRGMLRVLLFVTDNFPGITKLIRGIFPLAMHQLCIVHLIRNAKLHMRKEEYKRFREEIRKVEKAVDFEEAYTIFLEIVKWIRERGYRYFGRELEKKAENYVVFVRFPMELRSRVKSTNASENLHKELEVIRRNGGGYFQSKRILEAKWGIYLSSLEEGRWRKPEARFKGMLSELHRMFYSIYETEEAM